MEETCQCPAEGWCPAYKREMLGREYEICSGHCPPERPCPSDSSTNAHKARWTAQVSYWSLLRWRWLKFSNRLELIKTPLRRLKLFASALLRHVLAGLPHATIEEQAIRRRICTRCSQFDADRDECKACGCKLGAEQGKRKLIRKILWAGEACPLWQESGPRPACMPSAPEGGWGPANGVSLFRRIRNRLIG